MLKQILVYLPEHPDTPISYASFDLQGQMVDCKKEAALSELTTLAAGCAIIAIIPATDVTLTETIMPKLSMQRLRQAIPFALEDQVLTDLNETHFALGRYQANQPLNIGMIQHQKMQSYIERLSEHQLAASILIPETLALPYTEDQWHILIKGQLAIVRTSPTQGFASDLENLELILQTTPVDKRPARLHIHGLGQEPAWKTDLIPCEIAATESHYMQAFAKWYTTPAFNLLQKPYQAKTPQQSYTRIWRYAAYALASWVGAMLIGNIVSLMILHHRAADLDKQMLAAYQQVFPEAKELIEPKHRMSEKLNNLLTANHRNPLILWLGYLAESHSQHPELHIQSMDYQNQQLHIPFDAPNFDVIDTFAKSLTSAGLTVTQEHLEKQGDKITGRLLISGAKHT